MTVSFSEAPFTLHY